MPQLSEEIHNAPVVIPQSLITGLTINGCLGFAMVVATLFSMGDIDAAMAENPRYPFMAIFQHSIGSTTGAAVMSSLVVVMCFSALTSVLASNYLPNLLGICSRSRSPRLENPDQG